MARANRSAGGGKSQGPQGIAALDALRSSMFADDPTAFTRSEYMERHGLTKRVAANELAKLVAAGHIAPSTKRARVERDGTSFISTIKAYRIVEKTK